MTVLLFKSDEQPISKWTNLPITLNALVSILAGIAKASLAFVISMCFSQGKWNWLSQSPQPLIDFDRFDAASRGASGNLRVIKSCIRRPHWIALGALSAIALLAFEPFTQAILSFQSRPVILKPEEYVEMARANNQSISPVPSIGQSTRLDAGSWIGFGGGENAFLTVGFPGPNNNTYAYGSDLSASNVQDDMGMKAALWNGFSSLVTTQNLWPAFTCASGNCSWTNFASIAVCHKCQDISQHVITTSGGNRIPDIYMPPTWGRGARPSISNQAPAANYYQRLQNLTYTKHEIPDMNLNLSNYNGKAKCTSQNDNCPDTYLSLRVTTNPGQTFKSKDLNTMIVAIQYLAANESWKENRTIWEKTQITSQECSLFFCVNEYDDVLSQGVLDERITNPWRDRTTGSYSSSGPDSGNVAKFFKYANFSLDMGNALVKLSDLQIKIPDEYFDKSSLPTQTFNITQTTILSLLGVLNEGFWGFNAQDSYASSSPARWIYPAMGSKRPPGFVVGLGESNNTVTTMKNVAESLTKWIRDYDLEKNPKKGSATATIIIIRVQWYFFIFPAIAFCIGMAFTFLCIWEIRRLGRPALKDSILSTLACAPGEDLRLRLKAAAVAGSLQELGKEVLVIWDKDEGIGQLKQWEDV
ncbi:hypothetical protein F53441_11905 [Fusarium austroafricanum]|uniref:Uncharacterized protein n=1 Tax=Fusarium austroafricanum TaxID=2364996 RepID=A0A8H4JZF7_9HYPO|nr:hypothetical protein F53441_11905 [Fusarium austroafricanum]